jgi:hypothetical protein
MSDKNKDNYKYYCETFNCLCSEMNCTYKFMHKLKGIRKECEFCIEIK